MHLGDPGAFRASINFLSQNERLLPGSKNAWVVTSRSPQLTITGTTFKYSFEQLTLPGCRSFRIVERMALDLLSDVSLSLAEDTGERTLGFRPLPLSLLSRRRGQSFLK